MPKEKVKRVLLFVGKAFLSVAILAFAYVSICFLRFFYEEKTTNVADVIHGDGKSLTIVYRAGCSRCKRTLPKLLLRSGFTFKTENVINADKLSKKQLNELGVTITPTFIYEGEAYNTTDWKTINHLWEISHK